MRRVSRNFANCHATVQKLLVRQVLNQVSAVANYPRESEGLCFYRRWFVCLSVCLFVTTITK